MAEKKGKGIPIIIPKKLEKEASRKAEELFEKNFSKMSWGIRMSISILIDILSIPFGFFPVVDAITALIVGWLGTALWGKVGWLNLWEVASHLVLPPILSGFVAIVPTLTIAGLWWRAEHGHNKQETKFQGYEIRPEIKNFFRDPLGLIREDFKEISERYSLRPEIKKIFSKIKRRK